ncbi:MAG: glycerophosphodiester phosphodiesterase family protein [Pseudomonadota bacterium]
MRWLPQGFFERPFAHRALHGAGRPENGLSAVRAAVAAGYGIEIDVQPSSDNRAMVFHDAALDRMTLASGPIQDRNASELGRIRLMGSDDTVPTLTQILDEVAGQVPLVIEIKDQSGLFGPTDGMLEAAVAQAIETYHGPLAIMSFNPHTVARMRDLAPECPRGLTTETFTSDTAPGASDAALLALTEMTMLDETGACFISHDVEDLSSAAVSAVRNRGLPILCWTVRSQKVADQALKIADQITFEGFTPG